MASSDYTILVVDDDENNRDMLSRRLKRKEYKVLTASDGPEALELAGRELVDLVILDIMMPGMSGLEVLKLLRQTRTATELPVIMASAKGESQDVVNALELGANDYATKPLDFPVLLARVESQLRLKVPFETGQSDGPDTGTILLKPGTGKRDEAEPREAPARLQEKPQGREQEGPVAGRYSLRNTVSRRRSGRVISGRYTRRPIWV